MEDLVQAAIEAALDGGATFADVRIENTVTTIIELSDGVTKRSLASRLRGAGIRAFVDGAWAFGQTTDLTPKGMRDTGVSLGRLAAATKSRVMERFDIDGPTFKASIEYKVKTPFDDVSFEDKMAFTKMIDDQAKSFDSRIVNTRTIYGDLWTRFSPFSFMCAHRYYTWFLESRAAYMQIEKGEHILSNTLVGFWWISYQDAVRQ